MSKEEYSSLTKVLLFARRWKRFLVINTTVFTLVALIISLLLPKWYRAEAKILGGKSELSELGLASFVTDLPLGGLGLIPKSDETLRYLAILNSRTVMMEIATRFRLQERYETDNWERTLKVLRSNVSFVVNPDETISILVVDRSPDMAAEMANKYVRLLDSLNIHLRAEKARSNRIFLESRVQECKRDLFQAEQALKDFQEEFGIVDVSEQAKAAVQNISELEAQILFSETELRFKEHYFSKYHPDVQQLRVRLREMRESLERIRFGQGEDSNSSDGKNRIFVPSAEVPELGMQYLRLLREVEVQSILYKFLIQQYEQARILEAKETPTVQVLDWALPPIHKFRPKRAYIVLGAFVFSGLIGLFFAAGVDRWRALRRELEQSTGDDDR